MKLFAARFLSFAALLVSLQALAAAPVQTSPTAKLKTVRAKSFAARLWSEAIKLEPALKRKGTQVHMGYWSLRDPNRAAFVRVLNTINKSSTKANVAFWDEGVGSSVARQFPSYRIMLQEAWYERAVASTPPVKATFQWDVDHKQYSLTVKVALPQADDVWGEYSQRYAEMAPLAKATTGKVVKVWCFVTNAGAKRVFYKYELPILRTLEGQGAVEVHFAKTVSADWKRAGDWTIGTASAPPPVP